LAIWKRNSNPIKKINYIKPVPFYPIFLFYYLAFKASAVNEQLNFESDNIGFLGIQGFDKLNGEIFPAMESFIILYNPSERWTRCRRLSI
jgi:hypothetical protein